MMKITMKIKIAVLALLSFTAVQAQDPIFTQYFMAPQSLNPGFTGFMETTYIGVLHRSQWPDSDLKINTDYAFVNTWVESMNSGLGVSFLSQRESFTDYGFSQVSGSYSYKVNLDDEWYFIPGIEVGYGTKSFGFQNLVLEDQLNIGSGTVDPNSIDPLAAADRVNFYDISAGMVVHNEQAWLGLSLKHLNKPNISFTTLGDVPLDMFLSVSGGYEFKLLTSFVPTGTKLMVTANYMQQAEYNRLDFGTGIYFQRFYFGALAATNPARNSANSHLLTSVNAFAGLQYEHFKFGYSYDFNATGMGRTGGVHEFAITYHFDLEAKCFGCPDYSQ
jgi:type IX secretion system PorP/SprF family membrane protein